MTNKVTFVSYRGAIAPITPRGSAPGVHEYIPHVLYVQTMQDGCSAAQNFRRDKLITIYFQRFGTFRCCKKNC